MRFGDKSSAAADFEIALLHGLGAVLCRFIYLASGCLCEYELIIDQPS